MEGKHILQRWHWGKSHFKVQHLQDLKQLIGTGIFKAKEKLQVCILNSQKLKVEKKNFYYCPSIFSCIGTKWTKMD